MSVNRLNLSCVIISALIYLKMNYMSPTIAKIANIVAVNLFAMGAVIAVNAIKNLAINFQLPKLRST